MEMKSTRLLSIAVISLGLASLCNTASNIFRGQQVRELEQRIQAIENAQGIRQGTPSGQDDQDH